ncbi:MAG: hypothetical protein M1818_003226 [Claussenomyces sp. TS43310]|nr:MAG: hypothetical protein M1818_003226 [Claussenomyces sp. TS43310]
MAISANRMSTFTQASVGTDAERTKGGEAVKKDMWSSMLDGVANGKRLPEKSLLVLGGSSDSQKEFLEALSSDASPKRTHDRHGSKQPPVANNFALGYTYHDVLDADQEDVLARLSLYLLSDPSPAFTPLLRPLLTPQTIPNTLIVILLDWSQPWLWLQQLRDWVRLLRTLLVSLDDRCKATMEDVMISWRDKGRGSTGLGGGGGAVEDDVVLPLGPGEWEEALGLPLCVVCHSSDQMEILERERAWKEEQFDFVLQFLRTILLKHGASLIYTSPSVGSPLQTLVHSSLGIQSLLKKQPLKPNVIDRDKVLVPPNWDSWGKIRVLREGFDVEGVNQGWSIDIGEVFESGDSGSGPGPNAHEVDLGRPTQSTGALAVYEETILDPAAEALQTTKLELGQEELDVKTLDPQAFLATQFEVLERIRHSSDQSGRGIRRDASNRTTTMSEGGAGDDSTVADEGRVSEHIGPVQFNMGGIQVDADDMLQRLKVFDIPILNPEDADLSQDRQSHQTPEPEDPNAATPDGKSQNEALASFFAGLMKRGGGSASNSPKPGAL